MSKEIALSLSLDGKKADTTVKSFKQQLRESNEQLLGIIDKFGATSKEAAAAAKKVAGLKDSIGDAKALADAFNPDQKFAAFSGAIRGVTGGFAALQGAIGLTGTESEDLQKTLLKVQSAMALSEGLNSLTAAKDSFKNLASVVKNTVTSAFSSLRAAIISTGIGVLVVGLGLLIANFVKVKEAVLNLVPGLGSVFSFFGKLVNRITDFVGVTNSATRSLNKMRSEAEESLKKTERYLDLNADKYDQYTQKKLNADKDYKKKRLDFLKDESLSEQERNNFIQQALAQRNRAIEGADKERGAAFEKGQEDLRGKQKAAFEKSEAERKKREADAQKLKEDEEKLRSQRRGFNAAGDNVTISQDVVKSAEQEALEAKEKKDQEVTDKTLANQQKVLAGQSHTGLKIVENARATSDAIVRTKQQQHESEVQILQATGDALGALSNLFGQQTVAGKILAIAQATINTYLGASKAIAQGGIFGAITAGTVIAAGLAQVKNIISVKLPPGISSGGASSSVNTSLPPAPLQPSTNTTAINQSAINTQGNAAIRAYVVERDMTTGQERQKRLSRAARLE